jgi:hypothetical protein
MRGTYHDRVSPLSLLRWTGILLGLHLAWLVVRYALGFPIWGDEAFVAVTLQEQGFAGLLAPQEYGQVAPLLWWWIEEALHAAFGGSVWALRLPAMLAAILTTGLMLRLTLRALPQPSALFAFAVFAVAYYPLRHGVELKPYSLDLLWATAMLNLALDLWSPTAAQDSHRRAKLLGLMALSLVGVWASFPSLFVSAALGLACAWRWRPGRGSPDDPSPLSSTAILAWGLLLMANAWWMVEAFAGPHAAAAPWLPAMDMWTRTFPPLEAWWRIPLWLVTMHTGWLSAYPTGGPPPGSALNFALILLGAVALWRARRRAFLWLLLGPLVFNLLAAFGERYPYGGSVRVSIFMAPAFCLLLGHGLGLVLDRLPRRGAALGGHLLLGLFAVFGLSGMVRDFQQPYKGIGDLRAQEFARGLAAEVEAGDRLFVGLARSPDGGLSMLDHGGSLARLRYVLGEGLPAEVEVEFHPLGIPATAAQGTALTEGDAIWLLAYRDDNQTLLPFDQEAMQAWRRELEAVHGPAAELLTLEFQGTESVSLWRIGRQAPPR